jgi:uncharacterized membrane protein YczE
MELAVLATGALLGGTIGFGTVLLALTIGPNLHHFLERFRLEPAAA